MKIAVIGGGVMGSASAWLLAERGADVEILERAVPGAEASSAAAGILGAQIEEPHAKDADVAKARAHRHAMIAARDAWAMWAETLREKTGIDIGYRACGAMHVAFEEEERARMVAEVRAQREDGLAAEFLDGPFAREIEPLLSPRAICAAHFEKDAQLDPRALLRALAVACARAGVKTRSGAMVRGLAIETDACVGVHVGNEVVRADAVILAAGSWSSLVPGVPKSLPEVVPMRGQMALLEERPPRARVILFGARGYVVPRGDGRVLAGSTMERVGHKRGVTAEGVRDILTTATTLIPSLAEAELCETWSNFRPYAGEAEPLVGKSPLSGLFLATGHHRNGILLSMRTAEIVRDAITGTE